MAETRRLTDWYCTRCGIALVNSTAKGGRRDTVTPVFSSAKKERVIGYRHDQCGGGVAA